MKRLVRAELRHLRGMKSTYLTSLAVLTFTTVIIAADFSNAGASGMKTSQDLLEAFTMTMALIPAIGFGLFAAARSAAEFRYGTIAQRALAAPRRGHIVAAKLLAVAPLAALVTGASVALGAIAAAAVTTAADPQLHLTATAVAEVIAGTTLFASLGVAVGVLSRNQTTAVLVVFGGWVFEKVLEAITESAVFLPYALLSALADDEVAAGIGLFAITGAALAASASLLTRKDVI